MINIVSVICSDLGFFFNNTNFNINFALKTSIFKVLRLQGSQTKFFKTYFVLCPFQILTLPKLTFFSEYFYSSNFEGGEGGMDKVLLYLTVNVLVIQTSL